MPYTRRQVKKLLSSGSPLSAEQKAKLKAELHSDPEMGHAKKGSAAMSRGEAYSYDHRTQRTKDRDGKFHNQTP